MQKCNDSVFCKQLRGNAGDGFEVVPKSVQVKSAELNAKLVNTAAKKELDLTLTAYHGLVRVTVDESQKTRFRVRHCGPVQLRSHPYLWHTNIPDSISCQLKTYHWKRGNASAQNNLHGRYSLITCDASIMNVHKAFQI